MYYDTPLVLVELANFPMIDFVIVFAILVPCVMVEEASCVVLLLWGGIISVAFRSGTWKKYNCNKTNTKYHVSNNSYMIGINNHVYI